MSKTRPIIVTGASLPTAGLTAEVTDVLSGKTFISNAGTVETGTYTLATATATGDATAAEIKLGKKAWVDGVEVTGTKVFWLESYATGMGSMFKSAGLTGAIVINAPYVKTGSLVFNANSGITSIDITLSNSMTSAYQMFSSIGTGITSITINNTTALVTTFEECFYQTGANLVSILGAPLNLSSCTNTNLMFSGSGAAAIVNIAYAQNTIKTSLSMAACPVLSNASQVSLANGLFEGATAKTLTVHATVKTAMESLKGDVTGSAGTYLFTLNAGGAVDLADFIRDTKGWTLA